MNFKKSLNFMYRTREGHTQTRTAQKQKQSF